MMMGQALTTEELRHVHDLSEGTAVTRLFAESFWDWVDPQGMHVVKLTWPMGMFERLHLICAMRDDAPNCKKTDKGLTYTEITLDVLSEGMEYLEKRRFNKDQETISW